MFSIMEALDHIADTTNQYVTVRGTHRPVDNPEALVLEAWAQGLMVGALSIMVAVTYANMRASVLLHKLILLEVSLHPTLPFYGCFEKANLSRSFC
jgi:heme O synthase-like polyprenyltransferase